MIRRRFAELWLDKGGGFYGIVAALTFLVLEVLDFSASLATIGGLEGLIESGILAWVMRFSVQSIMNAVSAAIWPMVWYTSFGVFAAAYALLGYLGYKAVEPRLTAHLLEPIADEMGLVPLDDIDGDPVRLEDGSDLA